MGIEAAQEAAAAAAEAAAKAAEAEAAKARQAAENNTDDSKKAELETEADQAGQAAEEARAEAEAAEDEYEQAQLHSDNAAAAAEAGDVDTAQANSTLALDNANDAVEHSENAVTAAKNAGADASEGSKIDQFEQINGQLRTHLSDIQSENATTTSLDESTASIHNDMDEAFAEFGVNYDEIDLTGENNPSGSSTPDYPQYRVNDGTVETLKSADGVWEVDDSFEAQPDNTITNSSGNVFIIVNGELKAMDESQQEAVDQMGVFNSGGQSYIYNEVTEEWVEADVNITSTGSSASTLNGQESTLYTFEVEYPDGHVATVNFNIDNDESEMGD